MGKSPKHHIEIFYEFEKAEKILLELEKEFHFTDQQYYLCPHNQNHSLLITDHIKLGRFFKLTEDVGKELTTQEAKIWIHNRKDLPSKSRGDVNLSLYVNAF